MDDSAADLKPIHHLFADPDGDTVLGAKGGTTFFRVHSFTLKTSSAFFRTMFSLPQKSTTGLGGVLYLDEDADTLECLLRMICGLPLLPVENYDLVDSLLDAIEKYDMPGPLSIIRLLVMTPPLLDQPFRLYAVACRFGWEAGNSFVPNWVAFCSWLCVEAKYASTQTLSCDLHDPKRRPFLQKLSTEALLNLFQLHHSRREA